ncbi:hypothetical protein PAMC26577_37415 [Caballeronia sordidicola]|uniref:Uncharacterized protein n=1 Tax=Caballeronia sordidicola TaxID=196367 RepID=A0A242M6B6_CABSO|nr:hypothetical protein PAMC26577_37415 [Caballeronia sordidicola]
MKKTETPRKTLAAGIARVLKRLHYPLDVMRCACGGTSRTRRVCVIWKK